MVNFQGCTSTHNGGKQFVRYAIYSIYGRHFEKQNSGKKEKNQWVNSTIIMLKYIFYLFNLKTPAPPPPPLKGISCVFKKILWMKTIHYPNKIRSHLILIVPMVPFTLKSTSKLRSARHFRYSIVIPRFISRANTVQS